MFINKRHEVEIHLTFFNSITITSKAFKSKDIRFKLFLNDLEQTDEESDDGNLKNIIEISVMNENEWRFRLQDSDGRLYNSKEYVLFRTKVTEIEDTVRVAVICFVICFVI